MAAATHSGHCQACGRFQKLPNGVLAKHGYTVAGGFFSGVCVGSGHPPFERSFSLLPAFIASAQNALDGIETRQAGLRQMPTEPVAYVHNYEAKGTGYGNTYRWRKVTLLSEDRGSYAAITYVAPGTCKSAWDRTFDANTIHKLDPHYTLDSHNLLVVAQWLNAKFADALERSASDLRRYITWQQNRVATWTEQPLVPVSVKPVAKEERKVEFKPEANIEEAQ